jgi:hypothetical protein
MSPEKTREILDLFLSIFTYEWLSAFEILCGIGVEERKSVGPVAEQIALLEDHLKGIDGRLLDDSVVIDTFSDAKSFFKVYWELFKFRCAERRLILIKEEALRIAEDAICCKEVWQDIVANDNDFYLFLKMERHNQEARGIVDAKAAKEEVKVRNLERKQAVRRAIERNFLKAKFTAAPDRLKVLFAEELGLVISEMEAEGIYSGPTEMSQLLTELFPHIPKSLHLLLNQYIPRFRTMKDNPQPKLKDTIYGSEKKPKRIIISQVEIDHTAGSLKLNKLEFKFNPRGIVEVLTTLKDMEEFSLEEFAVEVNNLLEKIRQYCQKNHISGFQNVVAKLQKKYCELWAKSDQKKSTDSLKIGLIYTALGLLNVKLSEDYIDPKKRPDKNLRRKT